MTEHPFFYGFGRRRGPPGHGGGPRHRHFGGGGEPPFGGDGPPFGRGGPFGFWRSFFRGGGHRARRGDVRAGILALLAESPRNGYQIMQELEQRSRGAWRPSPGSIYPALQQLQDEGLVAEAQSPAGRVYELTAKGKTWVKQHEEDIGAPWETMAGGSEGPPHAEIATELHALAGAVFQITRAGSPAQIAEAKKLLQQTRRALYGLLAQETP